MSLSGARSVLLIIVTVFAQSACSDEGDGVAGNGGVGSNGGAATGGSGGSPGGGVGSSGGAGGTTGSGATGAVGGGGANDGGVPENMALIPASTFTMGCTSQTFCYCDEYPSRTIGMSEFYIDRTEVTRAQYGACVAAAACTPPSANPGMSFTEKPDHPVTHVDWNQANAYCAWLGKHLPSGAQWERAYRSTDARVLPWGSAPLDCTLLNYGDCPLYDTKPVGSYPAGASVEGCSISLATSGSGWLTGTTARTTKRPPLRIRRDPRAGRGTSTAVGGSSPAQSAFAPTSATWTPTRSTPPAWISWASAAQRAA